MPAPGLVEVEQRRVHHARRRIVGWQAALVAARSTVPVTFVQTPWGSGKPYVPDGREDAASRRAPQFRFTCSADGLRRVVVLHRPGGDVVGARARRHGVRRPHVVRGPPRVGDAVRAAVDQRRRVAPFWTTSVPPPFVDQPVGRSVLEVAVAGEVHGRRVAGAGAAEAGCSWRRSCSVVPQARPAASHWYAPHERGRARVAGARAVAGRRRVRRRAGAARRQADGPGGVLAAGAGAVAGAVVAAGRRRRSPRSRCADRCPASAAVHVPRLFVAAQVWQAAGAGGVAADAVDAEAARAVARRGAGGAVRLLRHAGARRAVVAGRAVGVRRRTSSAHAVGAAHVRAARRGGRRLAGARAVAGAGGRVRRAAARLGRRRRCRPSAAAGAGAVARAVVAAGRRGVLRALVVGIGAADDRAAEAVGLRRSWRPSRRRSRRRRRCRSRRRRRSCRSRTRPAAAQAAPLRLQRHAAPCRAQKLPAAQSAFEAHDVLHDGGAANVRAARRWW